MNSIDSNKAWNRIDDDITQFNERQYLNKYRSTEFIIRNLKKEIGHLKNLNILDVGCGGGANLYYLAKEFPLHQFTGTDINKHYIAFASNKHKQLGIKNTQFCYNDFSSTDLPAGYDVIGSSQVLNIVDKKKGKSF